MHQQVFVACPPAAMFADKAERVGIASAIKLLRGI
jgi:hypothetical protein